MEKPSVSHTFGEVDLERENENIRVEANPLLETFNLKSGDLVQTKGDSYAELSDHVKESTNVTLFPNSKLSVQVNDTSIEKIDLIKGLFRVESKDGVSTPLTDFDFSFQFGLQPIFVRILNGVTVFSSVYAPIEILCGETKVEIRESQQVEFSSEGFSEKTSASKEFENAERAWRTFKSSIQKQLGEVSIDQGLPEGLEEASELFAERSGEKVDFDKEEYVEMLEGWSEQGDKDLEVLTETSFSGVEKERFNLGLSFSYKGLSFKIPSVELSSYDDEFDILSISLVGKNESEDPSFIFYEEEVHLSDKNGEILALKSYDGESSIFPEQDFEASVEFLVPKDEDSFEFVFGDSVNLDISLEKEEKNARI